MAIHMKTHNAAFLVLGCLSLLLEGVGSVLLASARSSADDALALGILLTIVGALAMAVGASFLAAGKGRSLLFGLLGLLSPLGLLFLCVLEDRSSGQAAAGVST